MENNKPQEIIMQRTQLKPTVEQFTKYQELVDYFNQELFNKQIPDLIFNLSRHDGAYGFFTNSKIWSNENQYLPEISLNPDYLTPKNLKKMCSTLVHELCHAWQYYFGKQKPSNGYHNNEFSKKMEEVGLITSNTGTIGGHRVGRKMSHYILEGGAFDIAFNQLDKQALFPWLNVNQNSNVNLIVPKRISKNKNKTKYVCPVCEAKIWGKAELLIICGLCSVYSQTIIHFYED